MRVVRIVALSVAFMGGFLSLAKDFWFAYLASVGQPVPAGRPLVILGHLSLVAFVLAGLTVLCAANREVNVLRRKVDRVQSHREIYDQIGRFLTAADKIKRVCSNPEHITPFQAVNEWEAEAEKYILENLGEAELNRFRSETNVPPVPESDFEPLRAGLLRTLHYRSFQLSKLIDEHRLSAPSV